MNISNNVLAAVLFLAIVTSIGGTMLSLYKLNTMSATGQATDPSGTVSVQVTDLLSITTTDNSAIDFGECTVVEGENILINSNNTANTSTSCSNNDSVEGFYVRNNGNVDASVNISADKVGTLQGGSFFTGTAESDIQYKSTSQGSGSYSGGCQSGMQSTYSSLTSTSDSYKVCDNLTADPDTNSVHADIQIQLPSDASGSEQVTFTFTAETAQ